MRIYSIILVYILLTACIIEESRTDVYSIEYDCDQPSNVLFFTLNSDASSERFLKTTTLELDPNRIAQDNENYLSIEGDSVFVRTFINNSDGIMRLDLLFYRDGTGNCSDVKGDAVIVKGYFDENNVWRNRFYPVDCEKQTELILMYYNPDERQVCGRFSFTVRVQNQMYTVSNGYFNLTLP